MRCVGVSFGEIVRNTPILVQLLWVYSVLPIGVGINAVTVPIIGCWPPTMAIGKWERRLVER